MNELASIVLAKQPTVTKLLGRMQVMLQIWFESRKETHMTTASKSIKQGLTEAIAHAKTKISFDIVVIFLNLAFKIPLYFR